MYKKLTSRLKRGEMNCRLGHLGDLKLTLGSSYKKSPGISALEIAKTSSMVLITVVFLSSPFL